MSGQRSHVRDVVLSIALLCGPQMTKGAFAQERHAPTGHATSVRARYKERLRDACGNRWIVSIVAEDENIDVPSVGSGFSGQDRRAVGTYNLVMRRVCQRPFRPQHIGLFGYENRADDRGVFNLSRTEVYALHPRHAGEPDLIIVSQYGTSNTDTGRAFFIEHGRLVPTRFRAPLDRDTLACICDSSRIKCIGPYTYEARYYDNAKPDDGGGNWREVWRFSPVHRTFRLVKRTSEWPG